MTTPLKKQYISTENDWEYYATEHSLPDLLCEKAPEQYPCVAVWSGTSEDDGNDYAEYIYLSDFGPCTFRIEHMAYDQSTDDNNYTRRVDDDYSLGSEERLLVEVRKIEAKVRENTMWLGEWADKNGCCITEISRIFEVPKSLYAQAADEGFEEGRARALERSRLEAENAKIRKEIQDKQELLRLLKLYPDQA